MGNRMQESGFPSEAAQPASAPKESENMIEVTRLNKKEFVLNCDWIETVEATPDTVITLTNGKKYVVAEKVEDVIEKIIEYKRKIFCANYGNYITG
jgi:flagellar protein FlbD